MKYISEQEACNRLSKIIRQDISRDEMLELSEAGVIPAYMEFHPVDDCMYPGNRFFFVNALVEDVCMGNGMEAELRLLPFPLRDGGIFRAAEWAYHGSNRVPTLRTQDYKVFALRADGHLDAISEDHFIRVYALHEVRPSSAKVKQYLRNKKVEPTVHGYCNAFDGFDIVTVGEWTGMSPFTDDPDYLNSEKLLGSDKLDPRERTSLYLMIAALATKAGYPLDHPSKAEAMLKNDLAAMGICNALSGKQTAEKFFEAAAQAADKAKNNESE